MSEPLRVLSLGAGVQSTTLALMAAHGELGFRVDSAVFADTGDEPQAVYDHLRWLRSGNVLPFPVHVVSATASLGAELLAGNDEARIPLFVGSGGLANRQCTRNFKLRPLKKKVRDLLGAGARGRAKRGAAESLIGISTDEIIRMKPSGVQFIDNRHPLIERRMSRSDCKGWLVRNGYPIPPKSACVQCPFRRNVQWRAMRREAPADFAKACRFDEAIRAPDQVERFRGRLYVHEQRVPLAEADLKEPDRAQGDLFLHECEGMCGV